MKYKRILIVTDDSPTSLKAVKYGYDLAVQLHAKVALLGVMDEALTKGNVDAGIFPEQAELDEKKLLEAFLLSVKKDYAHGIDTQIFTPRGNIKTVCLQMAKEWDADLIVAGTHGRKGLSRLFMGSIAEGILRNSKIPVFIVPIDGN